jgi:hypothetical protein
MERGGARARSRLLVALAIALAACGDGASSAGSSQAASAASSSAVASASIAPTAASASASTSASALDANAAIPMTKRFSAVGDKETRIKEKSLALKLDLKSGGTASQEDTAEQSTVEKVTEVVAVEGELVTKIKVEYRRHLAKRRNGRGNTDEKSPLEGKTYLVELKDKQVVITGADGKPPPARELDELKEDHKNFGKGPRLLKAFPDSVKVGDSLDEFAKVFSEAAAGGAEGQGDIKKAVAKVTGVREENGVRVVTISIDIGMEGKLRAGMEGKVSMSGTMDIRADRCWPVASKVSGPVEFTFAGKGLSGTAKGTLSESTTATYVP